MFGLGSSHERSRSKLSRRLGKGRARGRPTGLQAAAGDPRLLDAPFCSGTGSAQGARMTLRQSRRPQAPELNSDRAMIATGAPGS